MPVSDQTPSIQGGTDGTEIGNVGDSLKNALHDGSGNPLSSTAGSLNVNITGGAGSGGTAQADKSTFTEGTTQFTPTGGVYNETISSDPTEDQAAAARITAKRAIHTNLRNNSGTEIATSSNPLRTDPTGTTAQPVTDNGGSLTVDGTVAATQSGTWNITNVSGTVSLPTGASTSALQTTGNSSLSSIDTKLTTTNTSLSNIDAGIPAALGQTTMAASMSVAIASNQTAIPITDNGGSLTVDGTVAATQSGTWILGANSGVDIGDVTINNAAGASAVNIQDGGNSITVDGTVTANAGTGNYNNASVGTNNSALPSSSTLIGGNDGTNIRPGDVRITTPTLSSVGFVVRPLPYEPATFSAIANDIAIGNNKSMFAIQNTTGSSVVVKIKSIKIINSQTTAVSGIVTDFRIRKITSFTGGTSITPQTFDTNDTLAVNVTTATNSTVSGEAAIDLLRVEYSTDEWGTGTLDVEANDHSKQALIAFYKADQNEKPITLRANQGLTIKNVVNSTAGTFDIEVIFTQE